jgi:hypothetical protein
MLESWDFSLALPYHLRGLGLLLGPQASFSSSIHKAPILGIGTKCPTSTPLSHHYC